MARKGSTKAGWRELMALQVTIYGPELGQETRCEVWTTAPLAEPGTRTPWRDERTRCPAEDFDCLWLVEISTGRIYWAAVRNACGTVLHAVEYHPHRPTLQAAA